ncbi:MAG: hypothetical protein DRJ05_00590 [Bacteroidetes bacterium]|nr:MAG: hypothetical protein DRJ05_00590 [Bacteroidota bacterium]
MLFFQFDLGQTLIEHFMLRLWPKLSSMFVPFSHFINGSNMSAKIQFLFFISNDPSGCTTNFLNSDSSTFINKMRHFCN